jgi:hypothetical protein
MIIELVKLDKPIMTFGSMVCARTCKSSHTTTITKGS